MTEPRRARAHLAGVLFGLAVLGALIAGVLRFGEARRFVDLAERAEPRWLLLGLAFQAATYATEAGAWQGVLARAGQARPVWELYALALVGLFTNQVVPTAGVAGTLVIVRALLGRGVPRPVAVAAVLVDLLGYYAGYAVALGFALAVLWAHHELPTFVIAMAAGVALVGAGITGGALWLTAPGRIVPRFLLAWGPTRRVVDAIGAADPALVHAPALLVRAWVLRGGNFALDGLTLWACLHAVGTPTPVPPAIAALVVGSLARTLGPVPGGLGTFEGGTLAGLALFGVPIEPGLAATLLFRGLSFWLPMLPGLWLGRRFARQQATT